MKTKRSMVWILGAVAIALIAGCGGAPSPTLSPIGSPVSPLPTITLEPSPPSKLIFVGTVGEVAAPDRLLVTDSGGNEVWITVGEGTRLFRVMADTTRPVAFEALQPGQQVEIELDAPLRKSNPMQAGALQITITGSGAPTSAVPESAEIVQVVMGVLRAQIGDASKPLRFVRAEAVDWPDACIGITTKDVMCAQVITPGYRVVLAVDEVQYVYHTDRSGSQVVLATGADAGVGVPSSSPTR